MIHLIYTSIPLKMMTENLRFQLERAVDHWGKNHSFYENETEHNFLIRKVKDREGNERLEWRRIFNRVLHIPDVLQECSLEHHGYTPWFRCVEFVAVATDEPFRKGGVTRFTAYNKKTRSFIGELYDHDELNRLQMRFKESHEIGPQFLEDIKWFQGYVVFFLEAAAIHHLADQALQMGQGNLGNPRVTMMCEKLERIMRICTLEDMWKRHKE